MRGRAFTRYQKKRMCKKAEKRYLNIYIDTRSEAKRQASIHTNDGKKCSCNMCGNPRRHYGDITTKEKLTKEDKKEMW